MRPPGLIASFGLLAAAPIPLSARAPPTVLSWSHVAGLFPCPPANAYINKMACDQPLLLRPLLF
jgi:hypothetical protein